VVKGSERWCVGGREAVEQSLQKSNGNFPCTPKTQQREVHEHRNCSKSGSQTERPEDFLAGNFRQICTVSPFEEVHKKRDTLYLYLMW